MKEFSGTMEAVYFNTSMAIWQIQYHLDNKSNLDVDKFSNEFGKQLEHKIDGRIQELCIEANRIGLAEVKKKYVED